ncbi:AAA family ATPase [Litoribacter populi]|uniref:AAA family ATPase n=1 Tax=Litoribacter populi TaxID=2598460 RepID=UPI00117C88DE|nr:ATP-binding protein [Litoribacter populi]
MLKVVIIGPESTGKSTLAQGLAEYFGEPWVPEYAREYIDRIGRDYLYEDLLEIAKGQIREENRLENAARNLLFCDTNLMVIDVWSKHKYGQTDKWIIDTIKNRPYDLYLLTDIDMPWEEDPQREHPDPEMRAYFFELYAKKIKQTKVPYSLISGSKKERLDKAIKIIQAFYEKG